MTSVPDIVASKLDVPVHVALILGSGLGHFADTLEQARAISSSELPGFPVSTVAGHTGRIVTGKAGKSRVVAFQGRVHMYEGYSPEAVTRTVRLARDMGAKILIVTNASGAFNKRFSPGDLMLIEDHINFQFRNPLRGPLTDGDSRWPDLGYVYDRELCDLAEKIARREAIPLKRGTLAAELGPAYETAAESRMLRRLGADAGCMSTVPEVIVAGAMGMHVMGISCITNWAAGLSDQPLDHADVQTVAAQAADRFSRLLRAILQELP